jgi:hypothetical protein
MKRREFIATTGLIAAGSVLVPRQGFSNQPSLPPTTQNKQPRPLNPFLLEGNWYKAALHVHTKTSDGDVDVTTRLTQYRQAGFQVVAVTDHWRTNDLAGFSDASFLAINSMEAHPKTGTGAPAHHFVCLDLPHPFDLSRDLPAQELIDTVKRAGGRVIYAHPYWTSHSIEELREVSGYAGVEVYNGHCDLASAKGYSHVHADQLFAKGSLVGLTAVDDLHKSGWIGHGWTMVRSKALTKETVMDAIEKGCYYASCGPIIEDCRVENGTVKLTCSPASQIQFFFNGDGGGRLVLAEEGKTITEARWKIGNKVKWWRAEVVDQNGKHAWTNPFEVGT